MSLALYRKYRPSVFADVIGQEHVTVPLSNALESGRTHHAYLFSGPRGCGKTSSARIMARSLNCEKGPTPNPCGECQSCKDLVANGPGSLDVIELDAATHGLVDDARDLRDKAFYAPVHSRYKIYIIDEAHQLGPGAANALLKVVEEPPAHVLFIFATTEPEKLKDTIFGRCITLHFMPISNELISERLSDICEQEYFEADTSAIFNIARASSGCMRLAIQLLEKCSTTCHGSKITDSVVANCCGIVSEGFYEDVVKFILDRDATGALLKINQAIVSGISPFDFIAGLVSVIRNILLIRTCKNVNKMSNVSTIS